MVSVLGIRAQHQSLEAPTTVLCALVPASHTSDVGAGEVGDKDVVEIAEAPVDPVHEDLRGKKVSVIPFELRKYSRNGIWLTVCQVNEVTILLRTVLQMQEYELMESLKSNK